MILLKAMTELTHMIWTLYNIGHITNKSSGFQIPFLNYILEIIWKALFSF